MKKYVAIAAIIQPVRRHKIKIFAIGEFQDACAAAASFFMTGLRGLRDKVVSAIVICEESEVDKHRLVLEKKSN